jgi:hypothetical protein
MEAKHLLVLAAFLVGAPLGAVFAARRRALRDALAFTLLLGTTRPDLASIDLVTRPWYRGTTRGLELCWLDLVALILLLAVAASRRPGPARALPASLGGMLAFLAYSAVNVATSTPQLFGLFELSKMLRAIFVFVAVARYVEGERELRVLLWALCGAVSYEFGVTLWLRVARGHTRAEGTLDHPNSLSMYLLISVPVALAVALSNAPPRLRGAAALTSVLGPIAVLCTASRTGVVSMVLLLLGVGFTCGSLRFSARRLAIALVVLLVGSVAVAKTWETIATRFSREGGYATEYDGAGYEGRGAYLTLAGLIAEEEPWGCGLNNWSYWVSARYGPRDQLYYAPYPSVDAPPPRHIRLRTNSHADNPHAPPAHSLYAITLGETGWAGVLVFGLLWLRWAQMTGSFLLARSRALVSRFGVGAFFGVVGAFAQSWTEWEIRQTPLLFLFNILLGAAAAAYPARPSRQRRRARLGP